MSSKNFDTGYSIRVMFCYVGVLVLLMGSAVRQSDAQSPLPADTLPQTLDPERVPVGMLASPETPKDNPTTQAKVELGRRLFFDPILSSDGKTACSSCHQPDHGFASPDPVAIGVEGRKGTRNAPSILNAAYAKSLTWDGREPTLESQVLGPLTNKLELGGDIDLVLSNLKKEPTYVAQFKKAFSKQNGDSEKITTENVAKAIASFERTVIGGDNGVDRFRRQDYRALSQSARTGMWIFESRGGCWKCHNGPNLTDEDFHNTGVSFGVSDRDTGKMAVTQDDQHAFQFRTPSLRNVELTAPYMHDGSIKTLREVVEFYNRGGSPDDPKLDEKMKPLGLSETEMDHLVEFLKALTGEQLHEPKDQ